MDKDRRKFERLLLPKSAKVLVEDEGGKRVGRVKILGRGGMLLLSEGRDFVPGTVYALYLADSSEGIRRLVHCAARYAGPAGVGFEFERLDADAAVEIGIIMGKYYKDGSPA